MDTLFNIHIKQYRAISEVNIDINGITVVAGNNGSGKSTIARFVYEYFNAVLDFDELINDKIRIELEKVLKYFKEFYSEIDKDSGFNNLNNKNELLFIENLIQLSPTVIATGIIENIEDRFNYLMDILNKYDDVFKADENIDKRIERIKKLIINDYLIELALASKEPDFKFVINYLKNKLIKKISIIEKERKNKIPTIIGDKLKHIYKSESFPQFVNVSEYGLSLYYENCENKNELTMTIPLGIDDVFYIDEYFDVSKYADLESNGGIYRNRIEKRKLFNRDKEIDNAFNNVIKGDFEYSENSFSDKLIYKRKDGNSFLLSESAAGLKKLADINILYSRGYLNNKTLLILDEPEVHLHPNWVVEYARLVVLLNKKFGVKFLIASHHPDFVSAIKYISKKEGTEQFMNFYFAQEDKNFKYNFVSNGIEIDKAFDSFNEAYDLIDKYGDSEV